jgi:hypothetical protein
MTYCTRRACRPQPRSRKGAARVVAIAGLCAALVLSSHLARAQAPDPAPVPAPAPTDAPAPTPTPADADVEPGGASELELLREQTRALEARLAQLEQAQVEAEVLAASEGGLDALPAQQKFQVYGFADFGLNHVWIGDKSFVSGLIYDETTFVLGNLNLYFDFKPDPAWQVLTEIRFTAYPHGVETSLASPLGGQYIRTDTRVTDVASTATAAQFRWGGILIERAYAQWSYDERFNVRVGQFLTPYGIWNVDHGTPTLIALMMPHFVSAETFPARQLGVNFHGAFLSSAWELGYEAYVSNGRTATQLDFTENKAFGGRLRASRMAPVPLTFGTSFYYGQLDDVTKTIASFEPFMVEREIVIEGTEWGVGVDVSLDLDALRIRSEGILRQMRFEPGKRSLRTAGGPGARTPDNNEYDAYLLAAYQLPVLGLEPFAYGEYNHVVSPYGDEQMVLALGLNIHFTSFVQLKNELARVLFFDLDADGDFSDNNMTLLFSRLAIAF